MSTGVYIIKNKINNKIYVGSSARSITKRLYAHRWDLKKGRHHSRYLQRAWNKYGEQAFEFIELEQCPPSECLNREQFYIDTLLPEYNWCKTAGSRLGSKNEFKSEEARLRCIERARALGKSHAGKQISPESRARLQGVGLKRQIPVFATDLTTNEEILFDSANTASKFTGITDTGIFYQCETANVKTRKGWRFRYA